ncbi:ABC transporter substrate-binding protein [Paenibacillus sediminis]|uniref:MarR-like DNA-binding transcriptional regulator SgrR of sgrS sRNA n=1 Tax=Paenibacillus sediminis TaxID=664909 RepID=A0ABS4H590_9BACL|nr:ABC transporter substrate-binding protein [Paenibacillus sediminis]MBP1937708.1 MarR-like DNA-binding transcriptional regulator SgrR of sgrS sRNA [Paenibacillus sediminis]
MRLVQDYLQLRKSFPTQIERYPFHVTMDEIANSLYCTPKNAKIIIHKLIDLGWVQFVSGRGRGHTSQLTFLADAAEILEREAEAFVHKGEIEAAFELIKQFGDGIYDQNRFMSFMSAYFGYQVNNEDYQYVESLRLPVYRPIHTLDPVHSYYSLDNHMIKQVFNTLIDYDYDHQQFIGALAHDWISNEQATQWIFYLRKGVQFHHGRELIADDVKFSLERLSHSPQSWLAQDVQSISILSRYTVQIDLHKPNHLLLLYLSYSPASIVPQDVYEEIHSASQAESQSRLPVGSGPYRVVKYTNEICIIEAFDRYYQSRAFIDHIEIIVIPEAAEPFVMGSASDVLLVHTGEADQAPDSRWNEDEMISGCNVLTINMNKPGIVQNIQFRRALNYLINRQQLIDELGEPRLSPADGFGFPNISNKSVPSDPKWTYEYALEELRKSAYQGEVLTLVTYPRHAQDAWWLQREYAKHGISIDVNIVSWRDLLMPEVKEQADMILFEIALSEGLIRFIESYKSTYSFINNHLHPSLKSSIDDLLKKVTTEPLQEKQYQYLQTIENELKDQSAIIFLVNKSVSVTAHPVLQGLKVNAKGWVDFKDIWFKHESLMGK